MADIRTDVTGQSVNEALADRSIRHMVFVQRFGGGLSREALETLRDDVIPEIEARLQTRLDRIVQRRLRGFTRPDRGPWTTARYQAMLAELRKTLDSGLRDSQQLTEEELRRFAHQEARWQTGAIQAASPIEFALAIPEAALLNAIVRSVPTAGHTLREWFRGLSDGTIRALDRQLRISMLAGDSIPDIVRAVRPLLRDQVPRNVESIVRTATNHVSNHVRDATFRENTDVVKGWQFVATLDDRTCPICAALDGSTFEVGFGPAPPRHPMCRCTTAPVVKSWKELGISLPEAPAGTRASMSGQVSANITYGDWLRRQPVAVQNQVLGVRKAQAWRSGRVEIARFATDSRVLNLAELRRLEPDVFGDKG